MWRPERITSLAVALGLGVLAGSAAAQDWSQVRIATEGAYPPWNATDSSGELVGFEVDLAKELCQRMDVECEVVAQDWEGIIPALQAGKYDAIMAGMNITEKRAAVIDFSSPYVQEAGSFGVAKDNSRPCFRRLQRCAHRPTRTRRWWACSARFRPPRSLFDLNQSCANPSSGAWRSA